jgi:hypothetical protein
VTYIEDGRRDPSKAVMQRWLEALGPNAKPDLFEPQAPPAPWKSTAEMLCLSSGS